MQRSIEPWPSWRMRYDRLRAEAERDRLLAEVGDHRHSLTQRALHQLGDLFIACGRRLAPHADASSHDTHPALDQTLAPQALAIAEPAAMIPNHASTVNAAGWRAEVLASEFSSAEAAAVVVIRMEVAAEDRVSVYCWDTAPTASATPPTQGERTVALLVTAPRGGAR